MLDIPLQAGDIVAGLEPDEHVAIRRVAPFGSRMLVEGIEVTSRREIQRPLLSILLFLTMPWKRCRSGYMSR